MKIMHLSDLHLGKKLHDFSLLPDQKFILNKIIEITDEETPDCIVIAGDVYDKSVPPAEAVALFDHFISQLSERNLPVCIISGNHDSAERIAFGSKIMQKSNIYFSPVYSGKIHPVILHDEHGEIYFYLLPFISPHSVREFFEDKKISSYEDAVSSAISAMQIDTSARNILIAHQYVTGAERCDSEEIYVGNVQNVNASVFADFDYVALGHLHSPQNIGSSRIRYSGTPLKYSFSEVEHHKSVTIAEIRKKGTEPDIKEIPLVPERDMQEVRDSFQNIMKMEKSDDYTRVILRDKEPIIDAVFSLRNVFPNLMTMNYENEYKPDIKNLKYKANSEAETPLELFSDFYTQMSQESLTEDQKNFLEDIIKEIWGENYETAET